MRFLLIATLCFMKMASSWAQDAPVSAASELASSPTKQPKQARTSAKPPFLEMEDSGCGGESLFDDTRCFAKYLQWLDAQLNDAYRLALARLPERDPTDNRREREQLRRSQRAWLKYKDEDCTLVGGLTGGTNPNVTLFMVLCKEQELKKRIAFLKKVGTGEQEP